MILKPIEVPETHPPGSSLADLGSIAVSNKLNGTGTGTQPLLPSVHLGNTPNLPTASPNSTRKTNESKASPGVERTSLRDIECTEAVEGAVPAGLNVAEPSSHHTPPEPQEDDRGQPEEALLDGSLPGGAEPTLQLEPTQLIIAEVEGEGAEEKEEAEEGFHRQEFSNLAAPAQAVGDGDDELNDREHAYAGIPATQVQLAGLRELITTQGGAINAALAVVQDASQRQEVLQERPEKDASPGVEAATGNEGVVEPPAVNAVGKESLAENLDAVPEIISQSLSEIFAELRSRWLPSCAPSEETFMAMDLTDLTMTCTADELTPLASLHGPEAEIQQLLVQYHTAMSAGDADSTLRINVLIDAAKNVADAVFGSEAGKVSEASMFTWMRYLAMAFLKAETAAAENGAHAEILGNLTFAAGEAAEGSTIPLGEDDLSDAMAARFLSTKEEVSRRRVALESAERDGAGGVGLERSAPVGQPFSDVELKELLIEAQKSFVPHPLAAADGVDPLEVGPTNPGLSPAEVTGKIIDDATEKIERSLAAGAAAGNETVPEGNVGASPRNQHQQHSIGPTPMSWAGGPWVLAQPSVHNLAAQSAGGGGIDATPSGLFKPTRAEGCDQVVGSVVPDSQPETAVDPAGTQVGSPGNPAAAGWDGTLRLGMSCVLPSSFESQAPSQAVGSQDVRNAHAVIGMLSEDLGVDASQEGDAGPAQASAVAMLPPPPHKPTRFAAPAAPAAPPAGDVKCFVNGKKLDAVAPSPTRRRQPKPNTLYRDYADVPSVPLSPQGKAAAKTLASPRKASTPKKVTSPSKVKAQAQPQVQAPAAAAAAAAAAVRQPASRREKNVEDRRALLSRVMAPRGVTRPDLGASSTLLVTIPAKKKDHIPYDPKRRSLGPVVKGGEGGAEKGRHAIEAPVPVAPRYTRNAAKVELLSGLHDTAECYEPELTVTEEVLEAGKYDVQYSPSRQRRSAAPAAPLIASTPAARKPQSPAGKKPASPANARAARKELPMPAPSDPYVFPGSESALMSPPRRSSSRHPAGADPQEVVQKPPSSPPSKRATRKPSPKKVPGLGGISAAILAPHDAGHQGLVVGDLVVLRNPHPILATAPDANPSALFEQGDPLGAGEDPLAENHCHMDATRRQSGRKRAAGQETSGALAAGPTAGGEGRGGKRPKTAQARAPALSPIADSEDQTLAQYVKSAAKVKQQAAAAAAKGAVPVDGATTPATLGCPKCRYSKNGCTRCRIKAGVSPLGPRKAAAAAAAAAAAVAGAGTTAGTKQAPRRRQSLATTPAPAAIAKEPVQEIAPVTTRHRSGALEKSDTPLQGMKFLVTLQGDGSGDKEATIELIRSLGGEIADEIPQPPAARGAGAPSPSRRLSVGTRPKPQTDPPTIDAVIADRMGRTAKFIFAAIKGLPVVAPNWLKACAAAGRRCPMGGSYIVLKECIPAPEPLFAGIRVYVSASKARAAPLKLLLQHAGATLVPALKDTPGAEPCCDLIVVDDDDDDKTTLGKVAQLKRLARQWRVPCHTRDWAVRALQEGSLPDDFHKAFTAKKGGAKQRAVPSPAAPAAAAAAKRPPPASPEFSMQNQQNHIGAVETTTAADRRKRHRKSSDAEEAEAGPSNLPAQLPSLSPLVLPGFSWVGKPTEPPKGLPVYEGRSYYGSAELKGSRIDVGSYVELAPEQGEEVPRVAEILALWSERGIDGINRPFGRLLRLYRPEETPFALSFSATQHPGAANIQQLFQSKRDYIERVSLAAVVRGCTMAFPKSTQELVQISTPRTRNDGCDYMCMAVYDHEQAILSSLPPRA